VDPLIRDLNSSQSLNAYAYVENRPLSWTDPTGWGADDGDGVDFSCVPSPNSVVGAQVGFCGWHSSRSSGRRTREASHGDGGMGLPADATYGRDWAYLDSTVGWFANDGVMNPIYVPPGTVAMNLPNFVYQQCAMSMSMEMLIFPSLTAT
jgi:hypothetical protein